MPYVTTRLKPIQKEIDIMDFLNDLVTLDMLEPPKSYQVTGTQTYYYKSITPERLTQLNIPKQIQALEVFYENFKHLDICNNADYDYERQVEIKQILKREVSSESEVNQKCKEILQSEGLKYNPLYSTFFIPKRSSKPGNKKWRRIDAPNDELKNCLSSMKSFFEVLMSGCYYHTSAFAYIEGRCTKDAVNKHANNKSNWFLKLDFSNFFGSITLDYSMDMLANIFPFSEIVKSERGKTALRNCLRLCFLSGSLPQGTPMSPILTNILMIPVDHALSNTLAKNMAVAPSGNQCGYIYTRYADDIVISNKIKFNQGEIIKCVKDVLDKFQTPFTLNEKKTRFGSNAGENWILGLMLNQEHKTTVGHKRKKYLKAMLTNYMLDRNNGEFWSLEDVYHLQGEISYCWSVEPDEINRIIKNYSEKYGDIRAAIKADIKRG